MAGTEPTVAGALDPSTGGPAAVALDRAEEAVVDRLHQLGSDVHGMVKPLLRGRIHLGALVLAAPAGLLLVAAAGSGTGRLGAAVYASTLLALFGASAAYHRLGRTARAQRVLRRLDHASIYLLIAGSYTPICLMVLPGAWRWAMLATVWAAAVVGIVLKLALFDATSVVGAVLYLAMGWAVVVAAPVFVTRVSPLVLGLLVAGGLLYTLGFVVLARRWPDPSPRVFGYHEVWHTAVVVAVACHYVAILEVVQA